MIDYYTTEIGLNFFNNWPIIISFEKVLNSFRRFFVHISFELNLFQLPCFSTALLYSIKEVRCYSPIAPLDHFILFSKFD
jgi:hypothetical protein